MIWEKIGAIAVDAGMVMVGDPCYTLPNDGSEREAVGGGDWDKFIDLVFPRLEMEGYAVLAENAAIAVESGVGDGVYPVFVRRFRNGQIAALMVDFGGDDA